MVHLSVYIIMITIVVIKIMLVAMVVIMIVVIICVLTSSEPETMRSQRIARGKPGTDQTDWVT